MPFHNKSCFSVSFILKKIYNLTEKTRKTTTSQRSEWQAVVHLVRLIAEKKRTVPVPKTAALSVAKIYYAIYVLYVPFYFHFQSFCLLYHSIYYILNNVVIKFSGLRFFLLFKNIRHSSFDVFFNKQKESKNQTT